MTKLRLLLFQTKKTEWLEAATRTYLNKITPLAKFEVVHLRTPKAGREDAEEKKRAEAAVIMGALERGEPFYLFDERGKTYSSLEFSKFISKQIESGVRRASLVIGGPYGFADEVKRSARGLISLSTLTLSHHIAQVAVLEQIYRALAIRNNLPYHND